MTPIEKLHQRINDRERITHACLPGQVSPVIYYEADEWKELLSCRDVNWLGVFIQLTNYQVTAFVMRGYTIRLAK